MTTDANELLQQIVKFYMGSGDFNGMPLYRCVQEQKLEWPILKARMRELVSAGLVTLGGFVRFSEDGPVPNQLNALENLSEPKLVCAYPTAEALASALKAEPLEETPFTKMLALGKSHLKPLFFDLSILEVYRHDPRYLFNFHSYSGWVSIADEFYFAQEVPEGDKIYLKSFGLGYDEEENRVLVAYLTDLAKLSGGHQQIWRTKLLTRPCQMLKEYYENTVLGHWVDTVSIYFAVTAEQEEINKLCNLMGRPPLFRQTFRETPPADYSLFFRPTLHNFQTFVLTFDKMLSENINKEFFEGEVSLNELIPHEDGTTETRLLGTLTLLQKWLQKNIRFTTPNGLHQLMKPLREVRNLRMQPAHKITINEYSPKFHEQQDKLVADVYCSLRSLRVLFSQNPGVESYEPPDYLNPANVRQF